MDLPMDLSAFAPIVPKGGWGETERAEATPPPAAASADIPVPRSWRGTTSVLSAARPGRSGAEPIAQGENLRVALPVALVLTAARQTAPSEQESQEGEGGRRRLEAGAAGPRGEAEAA